MEIRTNEPVRYGLHQMEIGTNEHARTVCSTPTVSSVSGRFLKFEACVKLACILKNPKFDQEFRLHPR